MLQFILPVVKALTLNGIRAKALSSAVSALGSGVHPETQAKVVSDINNKLDAPWWLSKRVRVGILMTALICANDIWQFGISKDSILMIGGLWGSYVGFKSIEQMKR